MATAPKLNGKIRPCIVPTTLNNSIKSPCTAGGGWHFGTTRRYSSVSQIRHDIRILADTIREESVPLTTFITLFNRCAWGIFFLDFLQLQNTFSWGFPRSLQTQKACRQHSMVWKVLQKFENADSHSMANEIHCQKSETSTAKIILTCSRVPEILILLLYGSLQ